MFKQDFAFRLVKLNQVESTMWGTEFINKVNAMVKQLEENEAVGKRGDDYQYLSASMANRQPRPNKSSMKVNARRSSTTDANARRDQSDSSRQTLMDRVNDMRKEKYQVR